MDDVEPRELRAGRDPRERASDRAHFRAIAVYLLVGFGLCAIPLVLKAVGVAMWDDGPGPRRASPGYLFLPGLAIIVFSLGHLVRRWIKGPDAPGKRARY